jgi:predicted Rossmann fold flavoprotein
MGVFVKPDANISAGRPRRIVIAGGGAAGFFTAITCAEAAPNAEIILLERTAHFLAKVKISGGGRCNVTHACFEPREFARRYPRGERALISALQKFSARDTVGWFAARGVALKTEADGRMFPTTDSSQTIIDCLMRAAKTAGVKLKPNCGIENAVKKTSGGFELKLSTNETLACDQLLLATGGCRSAALGQLAVSLGHKLEAPVPSLFTFQIAVPWLNELSGVAVGDAEVSIPAAKLSERGPVLVTHWGLSGPAVLRLSAWGARRLAEENYQFSLLVNWLPTWSDDKLMTEFAARRKSQPAKMIVNFPVAPLSARLWAKLIAAAGIAADARWSALGSAAQHKLIQTLRRGEFAVTGKSLNKDEFVTCGGVRLDEVDFRTMQSKLCPGLFFAGEVLDVDGVTGGFNFQNAWTTGFLAGRALADFGA